MGDLNCECDAEPLQRLIRRVGLREPSCELKTFPSWRPNRKLDHILASPSLRLAKAEVLNYAHSDHLPIFVELELPENLALNRAAA